MRDYVLTNMEVVLFTDGSSYIRDTVVTQDQVLCTKALEHGSQKKKVRI